MHAVSILVHPIFPKLMIKWLQIVRISILVHLQLFEVDKNQNFEHFESEPKSKFEESEVTWSVISERKSGGPKRHAYMSRD